MGFAFKRFSNLMSQITSFGTFLKLLARRKWSRFSMLLLFSSLATTAVVGYKFPHFILVGVFPILFQLVISAILAIRAAYEVSREILDTAQPAPAPATIQERPAQPVLFDEILAETTGTRENRVQNYLEIWKKTIDVQQHFNDLELRIRNFALTALSVVSAAAALSIKDDPSMIVCLTLIFVALITWIAFFVMDYYWYHPLLKGAVDHGIEVEKRLKQVLPEIGLTTTIGDASKVKIIYRIVDSKGRMKLFYSLIGFAIILFGCIVGTMVLSGVVSNSKNDPSPSIQFNVNTLSSPAPTLSPSAIPTSTASPEATITPNPK
jgi:hypothetical protein